MTTPFADLSIREKLSTVSQLRETGSTNEQIAIRCGYLNGQRVSQIFGLHRIVGSTSGEAVLDCIDDRSLALDYVVKKLLSAKTSEALDAVLESLLTRAQKVKSKQRRIARGFNPNIDGRR